MEKMVNPISELYSNRYIFLAGEITQEKIDYTIAQILMLNAKDPDEDIYIVIDSPGGEVSSGLALYNVCKYISNDIVTIGVGTCASMGAFLLSSGTKGKRFAFKDCNIMYHSIISGVRGSYHDMNIYMKQTTSLQKKVNEYLKDFSHGRLSIEEIEKMTERDLYLTPEEAIDFCLLDKVMTTQKEIFEYLKKVGENNEK